MLPVFMAEEAVRRENGVSPPVDVSGVAGQSLLVTLGITRIIQQESLEVAVYGSPGSDHWTHRPIALFAKKYFCGTYSLLLDLAEYPDIHFLRASWKITHWGHADARPLFSFYVWTALDERSTRKAEQYRIAAASVV